MTQRQLNTLVANATGESRRTVARLGFSVADPLTVSHDPELVAEGEMDDDEQDHFLDWDMVQAERQVAIA